MSTFLIHSGHGDIEGKPAIRSSMMKLAPLFLVLMTIMAPSSPVSAGSRLLPPAPATNGASFFFASLGACTTSGRFSGQDCVAAFGQAAALIRERAPKFADKYECILQFKLCQTDGAVYQPAVLGVEIVHSATGFVALPVLAVETPRDMLRDPDPPPSDGRDASRAGAPSPYGEIALEAANLAPPAPPSLKSYRHYIEQVQLRLAVNQQGAKPNPTRQAER